MISNTDLKGAAVPAPIVAGAGDRPAALEFDLVHHLPGRLRLRSAVLKGNTFASEEARRHLAQIDGVTSVRANPATGSVLTGIEHASETEPSRVLSCSRRARSGPPNKGNHTLVEGAAWDGDSALRTHRRTSRKSKRAHDKTARKAAELTVPRRWLRAECFFKERLGTDSIPQHPSGRWRWHCWTIC
jgi:hypothetical protein